MIRINDMTQIIFDSLRRTRRGSGTQSISSPGDAVAKAVSAISIFCESYVALIDAERLDHYHRLERERIHLLLFDEAGKVLAAA